MTVRVWRKSIAHYHARLLSCSTALYLRTNRSQRLDAYSTSPSLWPPFDLFRGEKGEIRNSLIELSPPDHTRNKAKSEDQSFGYGGAHE